MAIQAAFVLISDMHFSRDLYEPPELPPINFRRMIKWLNKEQVVTRFFEERCLGHSVACVKKLPRYVKYLLKEAQDEGYERPSFDLFILLGDQATIPDGQTYKFVREYLTSHRYETHDADSGVYCAGLGLDPSQIIAIPGNHDKLLRSNLELYNNAVTRHLGLNDEVSPQHCTLATREFGGREFVFILLEASNYCKEELTIDMSCRDHLANGQITEALYQEVADKLERLKKGEQVDQAALQGKYLSAIKILLVHYAVDLRKVSGVKSPAETLIPHECRELGSLVTRLHEQFQVSLVFHGHLHRPALYNHDGAQIIAVTTATQQGATNGFYLLKVLDTGEIRADHHVWNGASFAADPDRSLSKRLVIGAAA